jgi:trigger factor
MATKTASVSNIASVIAREEDGTIQITFTIPFLLIKKAQDETIAEMAKDIDIPGFRKGNAPLDKVAAKIPENTLIEHSLGHLLPKALAESIDEHKLKLTIYPKFELIKAKDNEDWEIKGTTCELPKIDLGDYKKFVAGELRSTSIVTSSKGDDADITAAESREKKEQSVIKALIENIKFTLPKILIEDEVTSRLSNLLARIEKLGLSLDSYLASIGKTVESLRTEYEAQAKDAISLDIILTKISEAEKLEVKPQEIEQALKMSQNASVTENSADIENKKRMFESILKRRQALDFLINLG